MIESLSHIYKKTLHDTLQFVQDRSGSFTTTLSRPKFAEQIETRSDLSPSGGEGVAIVMTGPVVYEDHFTRDTLRMYKMHYPNATIILSVTDEEDVEYLKDLESDTLRLVVSKDLPDVVKAGICEASNQGVSFVLRTKADQRIYAPNTLEYMMALLRAFPLSNTQTKQRIIASSYSTCKYIPFHISPMLQFGHISDMALYWKQAHFHPSPAVNAETATELEASRFACKATKAFLQSKGIDYKDGSILSSWKVITDYFCLVDSETLNLFTHVPSTEAQSHIERNSASYRNHANQMMSFRDWLILYNLRDRLTSAPEFILDMNIKEKIDEQQFALWLASAFQDLEI